MTSLDSFDSLCFWCRELGLPEPVPEVCFCDGRRWRFDACWPDRMIALEIEGGVWNQGRHTRGSGFIRDMEKYREAVALGWKLLRFTPQEVRSGAAALFLKERMFDGQTPTNAESEKGR